MSTYVSGNLNRDEPNELLLAIIIILICHNVFKAVDHNSIISLALIAHFPVLKQLARIPSLQQKLGRNGRPSIFFVTTSIQIWWHRCERSQSKQIYGINKTKVLV